MNYYHYSRLINPDSLDLKPLKINASKTMKCYYSPAYKNVARVPYAMYIARLFPQEIGEQIILSMHAGHVDQIAQKNWEHVKLRKSMRFIYDTCLQKIAEQEECPAGYIEVPTVTKYFRAEGSGGKPISNLIGCRPFVEHFYGVPKPKGWSWDKNRYQSTAYNKVKGLRYTWTRSNATKSIQDSWEEGVTCNIPASAGFEQSILEFQNSDETNHLFDLNVRKARLNNTWGELPNQDILDPHWKIHLQESQDHLIEDDELTNSMLVLDTIGDPQLNIESNHNHHSNNWSAGMSAFEDIRLSSGKILQRVEPTSIEDLKSEGTLFNRNYLHRTIIGGTIKACRNIAFNHERKYQVINDEQFLLDCNLLAHLLFIVDPDNLATGDIIGSKKDDKPEPNNKSKTIRQDLMDLHQDFLTRKSTVIDMQEIDLMALPKCVDIKRIAIGLLQDDGVLSHLKDHDANMTEENLEILFKFMSHRPVDIATGDVDWQTDWDGIRSLVTCHERDWVNAVTKFNYTNLTPDHQPIPTISAEDMAPAYQKQYQVDQAAFRFLPELFKKMVWEASKADWSTRLDLIDKIKALKVPDKTFNIKVNQSWYPTHLPSCAERIAKSLNTSRKGYI